ncbi:uncharacterized protein LOC106645725 [Copidosoma floridanum]|uniref:uncharacterized protein LOC106645725 n=1 Tax=Copidosoma floridanum TaxID=29053 RepID=UPI0006C9D2B4|nr:uncharacterized protein LOC106645725 [Copidosoma floridanum]
MHISVALNSAAGIYEYKALLSNQPISPLNRLRESTPFIDIEYVIRVGGRLQNAALVETEKYPIILLAKHQATLLLVREMHLAILPGGPFLTFSSLNRQFWLLQGRNTFRRIMRQCVTYARHRASTISQLMGSLPTPRVQPTHSFTNVGVDYAGPFWYKASSS